ncbi:hypothetical protein IG631_02599 [Alternaria alternata]|nr:hypothetical protein IG631_02599 [Alternaria alternata]
MTSTSPLVPPHDGITNAVVLQAHPLGLQYLFFLCLVTLSTLAFHLPIRVLCAFDAERLPGAARRLWQKCIPYFSSPTPLSTALLVSSCTKLFPILLIIWDYDLPSSATAVSWAVIVNNIAALEILMDCGYIRAGMLVGIGAGLRTLVGWGILRAAGLGTGWEGYLSEWTIAGNVWDWVGNAIRSGRGGLLAVVAIAARVVDEADAPASTSTSILRVGEGQLQRGLGAQTGLCRCRCGLGRRDVVNVRLVFAFGS